MFRYFYRNNDGDIVDISDRVQVGWTENPGTAGLQTRAEEGSVATSTITIDDPEGTFEINGHRLFYVTETECGGDAYGGVVWAGYTWIRTYSRGGRYLTGPGRIIEVQLNDLNTIFERRIQAGAENDRPAETDVERIAWLLTTNEAALIDDDQYFSTDQPFNMDAADYRGQGFRNILDDCSQQSGKNWFLWASAAGFSLWYGPRGTTDFASSLQLNNIEAEQDDFESYDPQVIAPAADTRFVRDPSRVYSGTYLNYKSSHLYLQFDDTAEAFARRDSVTYAPNVSTKVQAIIRANRVLSDIDTEEDVITTAIIVPRAQVNDIVAGQRVQVKLSHIGPEGYAADYVWTRCLNRTVRELNPELVQVDMELSPDEPVDAGIPAIGAVYGILARPKGYDYYPNVWFQWVGDFPETGGGVQPTVGLIEALSDPDGPMAPVWDFYGWKILGTGNVDVEFQTSIIGVGAPGWSCVFSLLKNGVVVASNEVFNAGGTSADGGVTVTGLPVDVDDVLTVAIHSPIPTAFFQSPRGVGTNNEYFKITGGTVI